MITKEVKVESVVVMYVAADGREFSDEVACREYDKTLACALRSELNRMTIASGTEFDMLGCGSDDDGVFVVVPKTRDDLIKIRQLVIGFNNGQCYTAETLTDEYLGRPLMVTIGYENSWATWQSLDQVVERLTGGKYSLTK